MQIIRLLTSAIPFCLAILTTFLAFSSLSPVKCFYLHFFWHFIKSFFRKLSTVAANKVFFSFKFTSPFSHTWLYH
jgi:hypothetical protein